MNTRVRIPYGSLLAALLFLACQRAPSPQPAAIDVVGVGAPSGWDAAATTALGASLSLDGLPAVRGRLHVEPLDPAASGTVLHVHIEAAACPDARPLELEMIVTNPGGTWPGDGAAVGAAIAAATAPALRDVVTTICADELVLANALVEERGPVLVARLREVGRRRAERLAPAVAACLGSPDAGVRLAAAGTLAQLGARAQVAELIAAIDLRDPRGAEAMLPALARIGGPEAHQFLGALAEAADDPGLRAAAAGLLPITAAQ